MQVASIIMAHLQRSETAVLTQGACTVLCALLCLCIHVVCVCLITHTGQILELLDSAARKERPDFAEVVWQWMKRQKQTPDLLCYNSLLYAHINAKVRSVLSEGIHTPPRPHTHSKRPSLMQPYRT